MELYKVISIAEAIEVMKQEFNQQLQMEAVKTEDAVGRICAQDITSEEAIPGFTRSTVDGYAVNAKDVFGASEAMPAMLHFAGEILMGESAPERLEAGCCMYVPTGGMLPGTANCVVMVEYSNRLDASTVLLETAAAPLENVIQAGEDIQSGELVMHKGQLLRPYEIGVLSSLGIEQINVFRRPIVGILSTGDEVIACNQTPEPGQVRDINSGLLKAAVQNSGAVAKIYGIIHDDYEQLKQMVDKALAECDIVLLSGGSSVGTRDQTHRVISSYSDGGVLVHGLAVKPGKPTIIGKANGKAIFGLPGHPLACSIIFTVLVKQYLDSLSCFPSSDYGTSAVFSTNYHKASGREEFLPVSLEMQDNRLIAIPVFGKSGLITSFARAYGYITIDRNKEGLLEGEHVQVYRF